MTRSAKLLAGAAFLGLLGTALPASAAILVDGNFDDPPLPNPFLTKAGGTTFGGGSGTAWTILGDSIDEVGNYWQAPVAGGGSIDLDGAAAGGISQAFNVAAGTYILSFSLSGNPDNGTTPADPLKSVAVSVGDVSNQVFTYTTGTNSHGDMQYALETLTFTSTGGGDILSFLSQDAADSSFGAVVGGISIAFAPVPEPATWMMLILGFGLTGSLLRKNRGKSIGLIPA
jgi:hypothetical protein